MFLECNFDDEEFNTLKNYLLLKELNNSVVFEQPSNFLVKSELLSRESKEYGKVLEIFAEKIEALEREDLVKCKGDLKKNERKSEW